MSDTSSAFQRHCDVSRETLERLEAYAELLRRWNPRINLVSGKTIFDLWNRHILDSAQLFDLMPDNSTTWADIGSGAGFPGAVVAILAAERNPGLSVTLVESDLRKATFLRAVSRETSTRFTVLSERIELIEPLNSDVLSARALAPLTNLLSFAELHLKPEGTALFPKGANVDREMSLALEAWRFRCEMLPSKTAEDAVILRIGDIERV